MDHETLLQGIVDQATRASGRPVLRVHWYDSARNGVPTEEQARISRLPGVVLGLGRSGVDGSQKGVDVRIGVDLVLHSVKHAAAVMYVVTGDGDLSIAVEQARAQQPGVQIELLAVPDSQGHPHGVSRHLQGVADGVQLLDAGMLDAAATSRICASHEPSAEASAHTTQRPIPRPSPRLFPGTPAPWAASPSQPQEAWVDTDRGEVPNPVFSSNTGEGVDPAASAEVLPAEELDQIIDGVVGKVLTTWLGRDEKRLGELRSRRPLIPQDVDQALLVDLSDALGNYDLPDAVRHELRTRFWSRVDEA